MRAVRWKRLKIAVIETLWEKKKDLITFILSIKKKKGALDFHMSSICTKDGG